MPNSADQLRKLANTTPDFNVVAIYQNLFTKLKIAAAKGFDSFVMSIDGLEVDSYGTKMEDIHPNTKERLIKELNKIFTDEGFDFKISGKNIYIRWELWAI